MDDMDLTNNPDLGDDASSLIYEGIVDARLAEVWNVWSTSEGLRLWMAPYAEIDLRVGGGGVGLKIKIAASASRIIIPMMIGTAYLRSAGGRNKNRSPGGAITGGSPVYPRADSRLLKLSTYLSPDVKLT